MTGRTIALLALGGLGWVLSFIWVTGGFKSTVTTTITSPPVTITNTRTRTVAITVPSPPPSGVATTPSTTEAVPTTDIASLAVLTARGKVDPVIDVGRVFQFNLYSSKDSTLFVKYRSAGGAPCAPTDNSDSGSDLVDDVNVASGESNYRTPQTWQAPGRYLFCMWLGDSSDDASSKVFSQTIAFRNPRGSVAFRASPPSPAVNQPTTLVFYGSSEAQRTLLVKYRPAGGAACAPTEGTDFGNELFSNGENGGFTEKVVWTPSSAGSYLFCAWLANDSGDTTPIALRSFHLTVH